MFVDLFLSNQCHSHSAGDINEHNLVLQLVPLGQQQLRNQRQNPDGLGAKHGEAQHKHTEREEQHEAQQRSSESKNDQRRIGAL